VKLQSPFSARIELQRATAAIHARLHRVPAFLALAAGRLDRDGYIDLLGRLYGFHEPFEAAVAQAAPPGLPPGRWRRADLLRVDLTALGRSDAAVTGLPRHPAPHGHWSPTYAMGCLYVMEGSTLGGRQLAARLKHLLPVSTMDGRMFLLAGADRDHMRWRDFCAVLDECGVDPAPRAEMIAGAMETFRCFEAWFA
jgi:heme oxygenase